MKSLLKAACALYDSLTEVINDFYQIIWLNNIEN